MRTAASATRSTRTIQLVVLALLTALVMALLPAGSGAYGRAPRGQRMSVIVRTTPTTGGRVQALVARLGGSVGRRLAIIDGFAATVPASALPRLQGAAGVVSVTPNQRVSLQMFNGDFDPERDFGSLFRAARVLDAEKAWDHGLTGRGVDVALLDSGVAPVKGLDAPGKIVNGVDVSTEAAHPEVAYLDGYGHGTHMAGIIAGRDPEVIAGKENEDKRNFVGMAPDARIVNVKAADTSGATDVSQVLAGIDWVVQHRTSDGLNIRVLNLSFGTDGVQDYQVDPLAYAVEVAWRKGIFVVVSAGNRGYGSPKLNNPASDPYVLAVGASNPNNTDKVDDDTVPSWSSRGDTTRGVDLVAPGKSIVGLRVPGSAIDATAPQGRVGQRFFRGSGTSQAAAVVSGAAALLLQQRPGLTPDQLKALLVSTARPLKKATATEQGQGMLAVEAARAAKTPTAAVQTWPTATGTGSLELARGTAHITDTDGVALTGEQDVFGDAWDGRMWSGRMWSGDSWTAEGWLGRMWSGRMWSGDSWTGRMWSGRMWSGDTWSGRMWSGNAWSSVQWGGDQDPLAPLSEVTSP
jgi:subtilisin family serine protease